MTAKTVVRAQLENHQAWTVGEHAIEAGTSVGRRVSRNTGVHHPVPEACGIERRLELAGIVERRRDARTGSEAVAERDDDRPAAPVDLQVRLGGRRQRRRGARAIRGRGPRAFQAGGRCNRKGS